SSTSTPAACASGAPEPGCVKLAIRRPSRRSKVCARFSFPGSVRCCLAVDDGGGRQAARGPQQGFDLCAGFPMIRLRRPQPLAAPGPAAVLEVLRAAMEKFTTLTGVAAPLPLVNVDTDMIIPKQFLKTVQRTGLAKGLFFELREDKNGNPVPDFFMNQPQYKNAQILIAGDNFGCGSSREH